MSLAANVFAANVLLRVKREEGGEQFSAFPNPLMLLANQLA
jgi:hypothetical protein